MLEPREADIPILFLVLVVLPVVVYILLGKWSEASERRERINFLSQMTAEEAFRSEAIAASKVLRGNNASVFQRAEAVDCGTSGIPVRVLRGNNVDAANVFQRAETVDPGTSGIPVRVLRGGNVDAASVFQRAERPEAVDVAASVVPIMAGSMRKELHVCARCLSPAKTRCSRCKSIRYCSGECQIIHWRLSHKNECVPVESRSSFTEKIVHDEKSSSLGENAPQVQTQERTRVGKQSCKSNRKLCRKESVRMFDGEAACFSGERNCQGVNKSGEHESRWKGQAVEVSKTGLRKSTKLNTYDQLDDRHKKLKMLFPYEEFVRLFRSEVFDLSPRGLVNFGNSCYANAVLQALTCTKPLVVYLLQRSHSSTCCGKDWCLMCELEQHVMMLRENSGPLSASRILSHMRSDNRQEDAHEFLRLLVASMQFICLERLGGESKVDSRLQETTLVQHIFGGQLRSKVKCLRCDHESERYENIMDLTLEIYGWVESLQDALTQFTTPEDLDGENMYRCSKCAGYVKARKQLSVHEAPNILTIVLKRFQEGRYGKINKCITFPEMLDMTPFMTRTGDTPPVYMLYAVVVHLDTLNASFSGHYISYVKDLRGNWFRIDDSEIHRVSISQVMSEGAYMLFYMRSNPRDHKSQGQERHYQTRNEMRQEAASCSVWSPLFTSSDEASFTTESNRDSVSTVDYSDGGQSIFDNLYLSPQNTVACRMFSATEPDTRYFFDETSHTTTMSWTHPQRIITGECM